MNRITSHGRTVYIAIVLLLLVIIAPAQVRAGQGFYATDNNIRTGMLVALTKNPQSIEPANTSNAASLVGVVGNAPTDLGVEQGQLPVQTDGTVNALVSTINGDINVGDRISPSALVGLGSKNSGAGWVVGIAQGSLNTSTKDAIHSTLSDSAGAKHNVLVTSIPVLVKVMYYNPEQQAVTEPGKLPAKVQSLADSVAGKHASVIAVVLSFCLLFSGTIVAGMIVVTAVRKGLEGITRQPLAKQALQARMTFSIVSALGIVVTVVIGSLLLLRVL